jgi:hypothetical protein
LRALLGAGARIFLCGTTGRGDVRNLFYQLSVTQRIQSAAADAGVHISDGQKRTNANKYGEELTESQIVTTVLPGPALRKLHQ